MYVEQAEPGDDEPQDAEVVVEPTNSALVGLAAAVLAIATIVVHVVAIVVASGGDFPASTILGYLAIALSVLAVAGGVTAAILDRGRRIGVIAAVIGVLANPWVLLVVLRFFSGLTT
jgi:hypothetical protein